MTADRPYGEFYDFYSASPEYFGFSLVHSDLSEIGERLMEKYIRFFRGRPKIDRL
jgi:hypothetical protein